MVYDILHPDHRPVTVLAAPALAPALANSPACKACKDNAGIEKRFCRRLQSYEDLSVNLWREAGQESGADAVDLGPRHSLWRRWRRGRRLSRRVDELIRRLAPLDGAAAEELMRRELPTLGRELVRLLGLGEAEADLLTGTDMVGATEDFVRQARGDDPELPAEDLGQALRNVWVVHFFQRLDAGKVRYTEASLGYSLLYPYTDNVLDDPSTTPERKRERSRRLGLRLAGVALPPLDEAEARVFRQLDRMDREFPRFQMPEIHLALQAIHRAQVASLRQQAGEPLEEDELLRLSVSKGGSSVLVDAYLASGLPSAEMARFAFVYGVALQLADDLQDVEVDLAAGHQTLFTRAAQLGTLDAAFRRLVRFLDASLELCPAAPGSEPDSPGRSPDPRPDRTALLSLARASMVHLMIQAVGGQLRTMPSSLGRRVVRHSPVTFRRARLLRRRLARRLKVSF